MNDSYARDVTQVQIAEAFAVILLNYSINTAVFPHFRICNHTRLIAMQTDAPCPCCTHALALRNFIVSMIDYRNCSYRVTMALRHGAVMIAQPHKAMHLHNILIVTDSSANRKDSIDVHCRCRLCRPAKAQLQFGCPLLHSYNVSSTTWID